jgi:hypothetical protein
MSRVVNLEGDPATDAVASKLRLVRADEVSTGDSRSVALETASPPDVRKGFAFPANNINVEAMPPIREAQPREDVMRRRKGAAFPHIKRRSRDSRSFALIRHAS